MLQDEEAPEESAQKDLPAPENAMGTEKILGMRFNFDSDEFFFQMDPLKFLLEVFNKRGMLKVIASVYDPLNVLNPWIILARLLFQRAVQIVKG